MQAELRKLESRGDCLQWRQIQVALWVFLPPLPLIDKQLAVVLKLNVVNCCPASEADSSVRNETKGRHVSSALHLGSSLRGWHSMLTEGGSLTV